MINTTLSLSVSPPPKNAEEVLRQLNSSPPPPPPHNSLIASNTDSGSKRVKLFESSTSVENSPPPPPGGGSGVDGLGLGLGLGLGPGLDQPIPTLEADLGMPGGSRTNNKRKAIMLEPEPEPERDISVPISVPVSVPVSMPVPRWEPTTNFHMLEIPPGSDIIDTIYQFASTRKEGVRILSGIGQVRDVRFQNPMSGPNDPLVVTRSGTFELLFISGVFLDPAKVKNFPPPLEETSGGRGHPSLLTRRPRLPSHVTVFIGGPRGAVYCGLLANELISYGTVVLNVSTFAEFEYHHMGPFCRPELGGPSMSPDQGPAPSST